MDKTTPRIEQTKCRRFSKEQPYRNRRCSEVDQGNGVIGFTKFLGIGEKIIRVEAWALSRGLQIAISINIRKLEI